MAQIDSDIIEIVSVSRSGTAQDPTNLSVVFNWTDGVTGISNGQFGPSWSTWQEAKDNVLETQSVEDVIRSIVTSWVNRNTGALKGAFFDAMPGKRYELQVRLREITVP